MNDLINYYQHNKNQIELNYPGINLRRLSLEYEFTENKNKFLRELDQGIPLEYINSNAYFYRSNFYVNKNVLIPRSESEILVELLLSQKGMKSVCEVGVGSFALGLSFLIDHHESVDFLGIDICPKALEVAKVNLFRMQNKLPRHHIELKLNDRLENISKVFDLIFSNPPYIKLSQKQMVHFQANQYEPHIALFLDDKDYLDWYFEFFSQVDSRLNSKGVFVMEGHEDNLEELEKMAQKVFTKVELKKDYNQRLRFLIAKK